MNLWQPLAFFCIFWHNSMWISCLYGLLHARLPAYCSKYADEYLAHIVASSSLILWVYNPKPLWRKTGKIWNKMQTKYIIYKLYKNIWRTAGLRNALTKEHVDKNTIKEPCLLTRESESLAPATCCLKFVPLPHLRSMRHPCFVNKKRPVRTTVSFEEPALFNDQNKYVEVYQDTGSKRNVTKKICEQDFPSYHGNQSYRLYNQSCFGSPSSLSECVVYETTALWPPANLLQ